MKNKFILLLILFFLSIPAFADNYYACIADRGLSRDWQTINRLKPESIYVIDTWRDFEDALIKIAHNAHGRTVVLDIDVHGTPKGYLSVNRHIATMGGVLNKIEKYLDKDNLIVVFESCYAQVVYNKSLRNFFLVARSLHDLAGTYIGDPPYPVYGVNNTLNVNTLAYCQYITNNFVFIQDLRERKLGKAESQESKMRIWEKYFNYLDSVIY